MSLHAHLRSETRVWHDRVDTAFEQFDLAIEPGYRSFLEAHALVVPGCEQHLVKSECSRRFPGWTGAWRAPALWSDLRAMGVVEHVAPVVAQNRVPLSATDPGLVGMMYVLEGSRLGGRVLARRVETGSTPRARSATRYLSEDGGVSWRAFLDRLEALEFSDCETEAALAAAIQVFCAFEQAVATVSHAAEAKNGNQK
jgi:heme oxygenase